MRTTPSIRKAIVNAVRRGIKKIVVARVHGISPVTVWKWCKRAFHRGRESFRDKPRKPKKRKITREVELSILTLRTVFKWGTARIQQGIFCLPGFMCGVLPGVVQGVELSRTSINNILRKHGMNGYRKERRGWKFFRARRPDELWQLDIKGPYTVHGKKHWFLVCVDDHSRYLVLIKQLDHDPTTDEVTGFLEKLKRKPESVLTDNGVQFKEEWKKWCRRRGINPLFSHPYYPQDKGKVERSIRNLAEEFIYLLRKFPGWLSGKIDYYRDWYNEKRFHRGINDVPVNLYAPT
jgi:hypothetical protein